MCLKEIIARIEDGEPLRWIPPAVLGLHPDNSRQLWLGRDLLDSIAEAIVITALVAGQLVERDDDHVRNLTHIEIGEIG